MVLFVTGRHNTQQKTCNQFKIPYYAQVKKNICKTLFMMQITNSRIYI